MNSACDQLNATALSEPPRGDLNQAQENLATPRLRREHWGVGQWSAFLLDKEIPIMPASRSSLLAMSQDQIDTIAARELAAIMTGDPFLAVRLLRNAELRRSRRLGRESTTPLASIMQTGIDDLLALARNSATCDDRIAGLLACEFRSTTGSRLARCWSAGRADVSPDEVAMAALLAEIGEMMLWHFAPELPRAVQEELHSGRAMRTTQAQQQAAGFSFKSLSLALTLAWNLPPIIAMLIKGVDNVRANIARIANDTARHIQTSPENPAIPADIIALKAFLPAVSFQTLLAPLPISDEYRESVFSAIAGVSVEK